MAPNARISGIAELCAAERSATTARRPLRLPDALRTGLCAAIAEAFAGGTAGAALIALVLDEGGLLTIEAGRDLAVVVPLESGDAVGTAARDLGTDAERLVSA